MKHRAVSFLSLVFSLIIGFSSTVNAAEKETLEADLESTINGVLNIIFEKQETQNLIEKRERILGLLDEQFPLDVVVRGAFGRNWKKFTEEQQIELITLTSDLILNVYSRDFSEVERPVLNFSKRIELSTTKVEIPSTVELGNVTVNLSYRLANLKDKGWQIYDILVEGRSMVQNYRAQFDDHFQKNNADDLLSRLREKLVNYQK